MDRKRQKLTLEKNDVQKECQDEKITALERKLEQMENKLKLIDVQKECQDEKIRALERKLEHTENKLKLNDVQKECQDEKITSLERKLEHMENKLKQVIAELEQVKEERARDKINFETEKCELESKMDKYKEQCAELQSENEKLQREYESQITNVQESNDDALGINSLPDEIIEQVFGYLTQNQLGQIARVCKRWNMLTKSPALWKKVNVKFSPSHRCQTTVAASFINGLPNFVTSIMLDFVESDDWVNILFFKELCLRLQEKCPHLEELILSDSVLPNSLSSVIDFCSQFLQDIKNLIFHYSEFRCDRSTDERFGISKIEILELLSCNCYCASKSPFSKSHHLKQLHLYGTNVPGSLFEGDISFLNQLHVLNLGNTQITAETFQAVQNHGLNLKEFYVCVNSLQDHEINLNNSAFPHLKTICLTDTLVTCEGVVSLIQSCPSLENVYVDEDVAESFAAHPFVVANRCKPGIVKAIRDIHIHNVDY